MINILSSNYEIDRLFFMRSIFFYIHEFASEKELINWLLRYINTFKNDATLFA